MKLRSRRQNLRLEHIQSKQKTDLAKQKRPKKHKSLKRRISSYFKGSKDTVKKRSFSFSFSLNNRPGKTKGTRCRSCINLSGKPSSSIALDTREENRKICYDELNISRLMIQENIVEKSLEAIILEAKQELFNEESCTNEYVQMTVNLPIRQQQNCCNVFSPININSMNNHYEPMFAKTFLV